MRSWPSLYYLFLIVFINVLYPKLSAQANRAVFEEGSVNCKVVAHSHLFLYLLRQKKSMQQQINHSNVPASRLQGDPRVYRTRFSVPFKPKERKEFLEENYWTVFGRGSLGSKAEELRGKAAAIEQAGFVLYPRAVLAMGFFDSFRIRSGIEDALRRGADQEELQKLVLNGEFNKTEMEILECISKYWLQTPLMVRSSAHGDCRGTGIYTSVMLLNGKDTESNVADIARAVKKVLASEFSKDAIAYRKDLFLPGGMAVMIEPVFGKEILGEDRYTDEGERVFGPAYSGIAYTGSEVAEAKAYISAGLPLGAVNGESVEISEDSKHSIHTLAESLDLGVNRMMILTYGVFVLLGKTYKDGEACCISVNAPEGRVNWLPFKEWLFPKLKELGKILGKQQYVEFAVMGWRQAPKVAILQIAEVNPKTDFYQIAENEQTVIKTTGEVVGSGKRDCPEII